MYFKTSDKIILKIKEEINKKGFFAFDVLENNFLSFNLTSHLEENFFQINIHYKIYNFIIKGFEIYTHIFIGSISLLLMNFLLKIETVFFSEDFSIKTFFILTLIYFLFKFLVILSENLKQIITNTPDNIKNLTIKLFEYFYEKNKRKVIILENKIYILNKELRYSNVNNIENIIYYGFTKNNFFINIFNSIFGNKRNFRKLFFKTEEKIFLLENNIKNLENFSENIEFGEQNFSNFLKNIENINISIKNIFINMEKIKKIENVNLEKLENYLKEKIVFSLNSTKNILEKNLDFINILIEKNKDSQNNQIILANKRLELQKNSLLNQINIINEKIKNL